MGFRLMFCDLNRITARKFVMVVNQTGNYKSKLWQNMSILIKCEIEDKPVIIELKRRELLIFSVERENVYRSYPKRFSFIIYVYLTTKIRWCLEVDIKINL